MSRSAPQSNLKNRWPETTASGQADLEENRFRYVVLHRLERLEVSENVHQLIIRQCLEALLHDGLHGWQDLAACAQVPLGSNCLHKDFRRPSPKTGLRIGRQVPRKAHAP